MFRSCYRFVPRWRVEGTPEEVYRLIEDATDFVRWWPAVWLHAEITAPGDDRGIGSACPARGATHLI